MMRHGLTGGRRAGALKLAVVAALASTFIACSRGGDASAPQVNAADLFKARCSVCHGEDGAGRQIGTMHTQSLKGANAAALTDEQMTQWIKRGGSNMPSFQNTLTDEQIKALVGFVRHDIQGK